MWPRQDGLKAVWGKWHEERIKARKTAFNIDEFGEIEIEKFDLDTADITGKDHPMSYTILRPLNEVDGGMNNGFDVRELDDR